MISRGTYYDVEAGRPPEGADLVSLKYDGVWAAGVSSAGSRYVTLFSRKNNVLDTLRLSEPAQAYVAFAGELMVKTQWAKACPLSGSFAVFPACWAEAELLGLDCMAEWPASEWAGLWATAVERDGFEGLVFRHSKQPGVYWRMKNRHEEVWKLVEVRKTTRGWSLTGEREGVTQLFPHGREQDVEYIGREFLAQGASRTEAGKLRHGQFVRWL